MKIFDIDDETKCKIIEGNFAVKFRFFTILAALIQLGATLANFRMGNVQNYLGITAIPVSIYLIARGYRLGYIIMIAGNLMNACSLIIINAEVIYKLVAFMFAGFYFGGLRLEVNRINLEKAGEIVVKDRHYFIDIVMAALILAVCVMVVKGFPLPF